MLRILPFFLLLTIHPTQSFSEDHLMIIGGGGEPAGPQTMFDNGMELFAPNLAKSPKWKYDVAFDGGHARTKTIFRESYSQAQTKEDFTPEGYKKIIGLYQAKIDMDQIKSGEQLIIMINTHGAIRQTENTHSIATIGKAVTDLTKLKDASIVNLDALKDLVESADRKGIKLGIVDLSCHSGATMVLKTPSMKNTCIITSSSDQHFAFGGPGTFSERFLEGLKPGVTLEQAYLRARADSKDADYPMISTEEHANAARDLYRNLIPYLYFEDEKTSKLSDYLTNGLYDNAFICKRDDQFQSLMRKIDSLKNVLPNLNLAKIKELVTQYKKEQDQLISKVSTLDKLLQKEESFIVGKEVRKLTWENISRMSGIENRIRSKSAMAEIEKNAKKKEEYKVDVQFEKDLLKKQTEILRDNPSIKTARSEMGLILKQIQKNRATAEAIAQEERKIYDGLYKAGPKSNPNDPCKKITF